MRSAALATNGSAKRKSTIYFILQASLFNYIERIAVVAATGAVGSIKANHPWLYFALTCPLIQNLNSFICVTQVDGSMHSEFVCRVPSLVVKGSDGCSTNKLAFLEGFHLSSAKPLKRVWSRRDHPHEFDTLRVAFGVK